MTTSKARPGNLTFDVGIKSKVGRLEENQKINPETAGRCYNDGWAGRCMGNPHLMTTSNAGAETTFLMLSSNAWIKIGAKLEKRKQSRKQCDRNFVLMTASKADGC